MLFLRRGLVCVFYTLSLCVFLRLHAIDDAQIDQVTRDTAPRLQQHGRVDDGRVRRARAVEEL